MENKNRFIKINFEKPNNQIELNKNKTIKKATTSNIQKYTNIKLNPFGSIPNSFIKINSYLLK